MMLTGLEDGRRGERTMREAIPRALKLMPGGIRRRSSEIDSRSSSKPMSRKREWNRRRVCSRSCRRGDEGGRGHGRRRRTRRDWGGAYRTVENGRKLGPRRVWVRLIQARERRRRSSSMRRKRTGSRSGRRKRSSRDSIRSQDRRISLRRRTRNRGNRGQGDAISKGGRALERTERER